MDPQRYARWAAAEFGVPPGLRDLTVGTGRPAQMDRRLTLQVSISEADGGLLGSGEMIAEYPQYEAVGKQIKQRRARLQLLFFGALAGMREGGEREFLCARTSTIRTSATRATAAAGSGSAASS
jgi:hypothetical protein